MSRFLLIIAIVISFVNALDNGLGLTPQMGYNSWYDTQCNVNESSIRDTASKIIELGFDKLGYKYINIDDCWADGRYTNGTVYAKAPEFNITLKPLADYIHSLGLKFGVYTDRGTNTCAGRPGSHNYEEIDAFTYAEWGVDYLKEDSCHATGDHLEAYAEYAKMRDALNNTGRPIFFSLCGWNEWYTQIGASLGNSWRIGSDDGNWNAILSDIDDNGNNPNEKYSGPGGWNDPCLLVGTDMEGKAMITLQQSKAQFSMWAVMTAPLLISSNVRNMAQEYIDIYSNKYIIDVNQDKMGKQGTRIYGESLLDGNNPAKNGVNIWSKELIDGSRAMVFINVGTNNTDIKCDATCFQNAGFYYNISVKVYDLWNNNKYIDTIYTNNTFTANDVMSDGGVQMYRMIPNFNDYPSK